MRWYVLQVMTGQDTAVCAALSRHGIPARTPAQKLMIRRRGKWQEEDRLLLPGYVFVGANYTPALFHVIAPISGVLRWLGLEHGQPQALDLADVVRWGLDTGAQFGMSTVAFWPGGWQVVDGPLLEFAAEIVQMDRRQRRATVLTEVLGTRRRLRFGIVEAAT